MKKLFILLMAVLVCFALVGCDSCNVDNDVNNGGNGSSTGTGNNGGNGNFPPFGEGGEIELPILPYE